MTEDGESPEIAKVVGSASWPAASPVQTTSCIGPCAGGGSALAPLASRRRPRGMS